MSEKVEAAATKLSYAASTALTGTGALTLQEWAIIVGIFFTVATYLTNLYFKRKHLDLAREQAELTRSYQEGQEDEQTKCS